MFQANVLRVMIASPGDVRDERGIVTQEIHRWNDANAFARRLVLSPVRWETHSTPQLGEHPQTIINRQLLDDADLVIGIFGTRIGTPTEEYVSGTVEEIKKHVRNGNIAKVYFSDVPVSPSAINPNQYASLQQFKQDCQQTGLYGMYGSLEQFRTDFGHHLDIELNQPRYLWLPSPEAQAQPNSRELNADGLRLLKALAAMDDGTVILQETLQGTGLRVGDEEFIDGTNRSAARWRRVIKDLVIKGFWERIEEDVYRVTSEGYAVVDQAELEEEALILANALSEPATELLKKAAERGGQIMVMRRGGGDLINAGGQWVTGDDTPRELAKWNAALEELESRGFVQRRSESSFPVTDAGHRYIENLPRSEP
jgi:predicted transcriptional regulator